MQAVTDYKSRYIFILQEKEIKKEKNIHQPSLIN